MPSLGDAYGGSAGAPARRRLYLGTALLFVGAAVAAPGLVRVTAGGLVAVGFAESTALSLGIALAGVAFPVAGAGLLARIPAGPRLRAAAGGGVLLSTVAVAAFVAFVPPASLADPGPAVVLLAGAYALGALAALFGPVVAAGLAAGATGPTDRGRSTPAFVRDSTAGPPGRRVPADGGDEGEQLGFPLDEDER